MVIHEYSTEEFKMQIDNYPSGALSYRMNNESL